MVKCSETDICDITLILFKTPPAKEVCGRRCAPRSNCFSESSSLHSALCKCEAVRNIWLRSQPAHGLMVGSLNTRAPLTFSRSLICSLTLSLRSGAWSIRERIRLNAADLQSCNTSMRPQPLWFHHIPLVSKQQMQLNAAWNHWRKTEIKNQEIR